MTRNDPNLLEGGIVHPRKRITLDSKNKMFFQNIFEAQRIKAKGPMSCRNCMALIDKFCLFKSPTECKRVSELNG